MPSKVVISLNLEVLTEIAELDPAGEIGLLVDVVGTFATHGLAHVNHVERDMLTGECALVEQHAHSLKGASLQLGGEQLGAMCDTIETAARAGDLSGVYNEVEELREMHRATIEALELWVSVARV